MKHIKGSDGTFDSKRSEINFLHLLKHFLNIYVKPNKSPTSNESKSEPIPLTPSDIDIGNCLSQ